MNSEQLLNLPRRLQREFKTVDASISIFCKGHHGSETICNECQELRKYAMERLGKCPFRKDKPTCAKCPVHCYKPIMREKIREVMRYAGPRMLYRHPVLAIRHLLDGRRKG